MGTLHSTPHKVSTEARDPEATPSPSDNPAVRVKQLRKSPTPSGDNLVRLKRIDKGSFGAVYKVFNERTGEYAALKTLTKFSSAGTPEIAYVRALLEIQVMVEFSHDNLLSALTVLPISRPHINAQVEIVSELMSTSLKELIKYPNLRMSDEKVDLILYQILRGVKFLHSACIIHRDLKPGNVLVNTSNWQVKICDFGLVKVMHPHSSQVEFTRMLGTPPYLSPEMLAECHSYGPPVDIWAVGCILAEMVTCTVLFCTRDATTHLKMITDLVGAPTEEEMKHISNEDVRKFLRSEKTLSNLIEHFHLVRGVSMRHTVFIGMMLLFNPRNRLTAEQALYHDYLADGRNSYHQMLCSSCSTLKNSKGKRKEILCKHPEPKSNKKLTSDLVKHMTTVRKAKTVLFDYINSCSSRAAPGWDFTSEPSPTGLDSSPPLIPPPHFPPSPLPTSTSKQHCKE